MFPRIPTQTLQPSSGGYIVVRGTIGSHGCSQARLPTPSGFYSSHFHEIFTEEHLGLLNLLKHIHPYVIRHCSTMSSAIIARLIPWYDTELREWNGLKVDDTEWGKGDTIRVHYKVHLHPDLEGISVSQGVRAVRVWTRTLNLSSQTIKALGESHCHRRQQFILLFIAAPNIFLYNSGYIAKNTPGVQI